MYSNMWLVPLVFVPFVLGVLVGLRVMKQKIHLHLLEKLPMEQIEQLMRKE